MLVFTPLHTMLLSLVKYNGKKIDCQADLPLSTSDFIGSVLAVLPSTYHIPFLLLIYKKKLHQKMKSFYGGEGGIRTRDSVFDTIAA